MFVKIAEALLADESLPEGATVIEVLMAFEHAELILRREIARAQSQEAHEFLQERLQRLQKLHPRTKHVLA